MQRFTGSITGKFNAFFYLALSAGGFYFFFQLPTQSSTPQGPDLVLGHLMFFLVSASVAFMGLITLPAAFSVYELDGDRISRRTLNGTQTMRWSEITRYTTQRGFISRLTLIDTRGQRLVIPWGVMSQKSSKELRALLQPHLDSLHERQLREVGSVERVYHPRRAVVWAGVAVMVMCGLLMAFFYTGTFASTQSLSGGLAAALLGIKAFIGFSFLFFLGLTLQSYTLTLTVTQHDITESSLFGTKQISFHHITSIMSREMPTKNGSINMTTIEGDGRKIVFTAQMQNYGLLLDYLRRHADAPAREQGQAVAQVLDNKQRKQSLILVSIFSVLCVVGAVWLGVDQLQENRPRMERYHLTDTQGKTTTGQITGFSTNGPQGYRYLLNYVFTDDAGHQVPGVSIVSLEDYRRARIGTPADVIYVPGHTGVCRLTNSIGRQQAEGQIRLAYFYIVMGVIITPIGLFLSIRDINRRALSA